MKIVLLVSFLLCALMAQEDNNSSTEESYIDSYHKELSTYVVNTSHYLDDSLCAYLEDDENGTTDEVNKNHVENDSNAVDKFFQNDKYLDETDKSFVRIRLDTNLQSKEDDDFGLKLSAQIPLSRSKKNIKLFIEGLDQDNAKDIKADDTDGQNNAPEIGMNYYVPDTLKMNSKYSVGIRGVYPFVRARYNRVLTAEDWVIEPTQVFKYSSKTDFEEETNVYFDIKPSDLSLFRLQVRRGTKSHQDGMDYSFGYAFFFSPRKGLGMSIAQGVSGNTQYKYIIDENTDPVTESETFSGISNYSTSFSLRHNVWKKWFFYELRPGVNFARNYDYEPNYTIRIFLDFFIGEF